MQRTHFDEMSCSVAQTINIIGEWWTPLILRDIFYGVHRFDALRTHLGISRKVLSARLETLQEHQILIREPYQTNPIRYEYHLTEKGRDLFPVIVTLMAWGDRWVHGEEHAPIKLVDRKTGELVRPKLVSAQSGKEIKHGDVKATLGNPEHEVAWNALVTAINVNRL